MARTRAVLVILILICVAGIPVAQAQSVKVVGSPEGSQTGSSSGVVPERLTEPPDVLRLYPDESKIIKVEGLKRVSITNPSVADVVLVTPTEILVNPQSPGRTTAYFWDHDGRKEIRVVVIGKREDTAIAEQIARDIDNPDIQVRVVNQQCILQGSVQSSGEKEVAIRIARVYVPAIVDLIQVEGQFIDPKQALVKLLDLPDVRVTVIRRSGQVSSAGAENVVPGGQPAAAPSGPQEIPLVQQAPATQGRVGGQAQRGAGAEAPSPGAQFSNESRGLGEQDIRGVLLEGTVDDQRDRDRAEAIARAFFPSVINLIEVIRPVQILVQSYILELSKTSNDALGLNWGTFAASGQPGTELSRPTQGVFDSLTFFELPVTNQLGQFTYTGGRIGKGEFSKYSPFPFPTERFVRADPLLLQVNYLVDNGYGRLLANPKVVTQSGSTAVINVGGQIPVPTATGQGNTTISFIAFGTQMALTPTVDHRGNIHARVELTVSSPDFGRAGNVNGFAVPPITTRTTQSEVTVKDGQNIVISGLIQEQESENLKKLPFLGEIPILGRLFQSKQFQKSESELVVVVSPRLLDGAKNEARFEAEGRLSASQLRPAAEQAVAAGGSPTPGSHPASGMGARPRPSVVAEQEQMRARVRELFGDIKDRAARKGAGNAGNRTAPPARDTAPRREVMLGRRDLGSRAQATLPAMRGNPFVASRPEGAGSSRGRVKALSARIDAIFANLEEQIGDNELEDDRGDR